MTVRGLLLDLQGVLYQEGTAFPGAVDAVRTLAARGLQIRFLTNTTVRPHGDIVGRMQSMGFEIAENEVFTPALAAAQLLRDDGVHRVHLAAPPGLAEDFPDFELVDEKPEAVVMGDLQTGFTWERLDGLFGMLQDGARLIALHRNRFCRREGRISLDLGPFVAALEYAAGIEALTVGKPSEAFFAGAVDSMGLGCAEVVMVGDDIEADVGGALAAGLRVLQVRTGKYTARDERTGRPMPTGRIDSIADLPAWLDASG